MSDESPTPEPASPPAEPNRRQVARQGVMVGIATGLYGVSFGALAVAAGLNIWQAVALSALLFSGGSQFALVGVLTAGGTGFAAVTTATMLGLRNGFHGLQVSRLLQARGWRRILAAQLTIDESTAVGVAQPSRALSNTGFWWTGLSVFVFWNLMTFVGALIGNAIGDPKTYGLDAAASAAFIALLWPRLHTSRARLVALGSGLLALLVAPHVPAGIPILVAALAAVVGGLLPGDRVDSDHVDAQVER